MISARLEMDSETSRSDAGNLAQTTGSSNCEMLSDDFAPALENRREIALEFYTPLR